MIVTSGSRDKLEEAKKLGASQVSYRDADWTIMICFGRRTG